MKMLISPTSPYARKARILVIEKQLGCEMQIVNPYQDDADYVTSINPLRKIPVLLTDSGTIVDSRVICEFLDAQSDTPKFFPDDFNDRIKVRVREALADGALDAGVAIVMAGRVAPDMQNETWKEWLLNKVHAALATFEKSPPQNASVLDMGDIALACALDFLSFRMPDLAWQNKHPALAAWLTEVLKRDSFMQTNPRG